MGVSSIALGGVGGLFCVGVLAGNMLGFHDFSMRVAAAFIIYGGGDWSLDKTPMADVVWACHGDYIPGYCI
jgi:hypothetical protein